MTNSRLVTGCDACIPNLVRPHELAAANRREHQRGQFRQETTQPWDRDYAKAYGAEQARDRGWSEDNIRKFG